MSVIVKLHMVLTNKAAQKIADVLNEEYETYEGTYHSKKHTQLYEAVDRIESEISLDESLVDTP